jgi:2-succinyl-6-hydroxy-2,4-cyclohexadiene-1-carboxylate synthase
MKYAGINYLRVNAIYPKGNLLFLHGLTGNINRWEYYIDNLSKDYNILSVDLIGHGDSDFPERIEDYSYAKQASDLLKLIENQEMDNITLICHSYSFGIALEMMKQNKSRFKTIVAISPLLITPENIINCKIKYIPMLIFLWKFLKHKRRIGRFNYPKDLSDYSLLDYKKGIDEIGIKSYLAHINSIKNAEDIESYGKSDIPALLIYKNNDKLFNENHTQIFRDVFINTIEYKLSGSGHLFLMEDKKQILEAMRSYLL